MSRPDLRKLRPWYVLVAMALAWVIGVSGAARSFAEIAYLRGDLSALNEIDRRLEAQDNPIMRAEHVRERAMLEAYGRHHDRATPIVIARMLLQLLLVFAAGGVLVGRRSGRSLAVQAMVANAALVAIAFFVLEPARAQAIEAVAQDMVATGFGQLPGLDEAESLAAYRVEQRKAEGLRLVMEVSLYLLGLLALTRGRAKTYFAALETEPETAPDGPEES